MCDDTSLVSIDGDSAAAKKIKYTKLDFSSNKMNRIEMKKYFL